ncbi:Bug family tripartite tricarboxylate transporter substrate binding protein [Variovorax boronicumulans]|uniref:Bug family tripartite tricarboxylate transporter substrate binding protein n=1 Tax=Variovorax boronicumulans TaxID=436515 RepID=UPI0012E672E6|nr:tripartite tricarboxylate transporter substrate binding protein [Variovorax boronicumulans]GER20298.1 tripartite tricarboxylate transporter substrate binding protein [Variovorax boronicumulans]
MTTSIESTLAPEAAQRRRLLGTGLGLLGAGWLPGLARAQDWPSRPIKIIAAQAPGSSNDATARALAEYMTGRLGVPVVVENRPGAIGMIAADAVARSAPDGYTLLITLHSQLAQAPVLLKKVPLDTTKDLTPIAAFSTGTSPMVVKKDLPVKNFKELIELARKRPVSVGNYGIGSGWQLMMSQLAKQTGAKFDLVNYKGTGPMVFDLMAGNIDIGAGSMAGMAAGIQRGAFRPILVISGDRSERLLPGIPTWADEGFTGPAFENLKECNMVLGPATLPKEVVRRLAEVAHDSATKSEPVKTVLTQLGVESPPWTGVELQKFIQQTWPTYQKMTRELGLMVE